MNKMFTITSIELGVVTAPNKEQALEAISEGMVSWGHQTHHAILELDEDKFWGNLTIEKVQGMRDELKELRTLAKNNLVLSYLKQRMVAYIDSGCNTDVDCSDETFKAQVAKTGITMTMEDFEKDMNEASTDRFHPELDMVRFYLTDK